MRRLRTPDYGAQEAGGKKLPRASAGKGRSVKNCLQTAVKHGKILIRDIINISLLPEAQGARDQKEENSMNKYELALVLSAKLEDEEREAALFIFLGDTDVPNFPTSCVRPLHRFG